MPTDVNDYTVGWICAVTTEYVIACESLDQEYKPEECPTINTRDVNIYTFGRIHRHNVVVACLPKGRYGITSAAIVAERMQWSFPALRFGLMVGIAGGAPSQEHDIRLGDVIVSSPTPRRGGVIQYDFGKAHQDHEFEETGYLVPPPDILLNALAKIKAQHERKGHKINETIERWLNKSSRLRAKYSKPDVKDKLYKSSYVHLREGICNCQIEDQQSIERASESIINGRQDRDPNDGLHIHYGLIASANTLMKDAIIRDTIAKKHDILCFEMEAAGLMNNFPCIVIRGICDYADTHKNDKWQGYAAASAAAYAIELLEIVPGRDIDSQTTLPQQVRRADTAIREYYISTDLLKIERLSGETLPLEKCYINLAMKDLSDKEKSMDDKPSFSLGARLRLEESNISKQMNLNKLFSLEGLSNDSTGPHRVFIQGRAGIGKTTLCKKIVYEFLQCRLGNGLFDRLLWLPLRSLQERNTKYGWLELLEDVFPLSSQVPDWDNLAMEMSKQLSRPEFRRKTLFLFDGLDEASREWKDNSTIFKFLQTVISTAPNIILTSRPQASSLKIGGFDLELEVIGFNRDQIGTYIDYCITDKQLNSKMQKTIAAKSLLQGLLRIPVQLDAFCCTWSLNTMNQQDQPSLIVEQKSQIIQAEDPSTMTTLYQEIMDELCRKDLARIKNYDKPRMLHIIDVRRSMENELNFLEELAFQGLVNGIIILSHKHRELTGSHFKASGNELPDNSILEQLSFLRTSNNRLHYSRRNYHFLHLTYQEFFAAKYFVRHWLTNSDLQCLKLLSSSPLAKAKRSSFKFLQDEKYNPQYSIFWRFVAGLIQLQADEQDGADRKDIVTFFKQLNDNPVDLLGITHHRLLMYCLSEVISSDAQDVQSLRKQEEDRLREWAIAERYDSLYLEAEFPEDILSFILQGKQNLLYAKILDALARRPTINQTTLSIVFDLMDNHLFGRERLQAAKLVLKNPGSVSQEMLMAAIVVFSNWLEDNNSKINGNPKNDIDQILQYLSFLPQEAITTLLALPKDKSIDVQLYAALVLQSSSAQKAAVTLIALLKDGRSTISLFAAKALEKQSSLSQEAVNALIVLLKDKDAQIHAAKVLQRQLSLSHETIAALVALFKDNDKNVRSSSTSIFRYRSLPQEVVTTLITMLKDEDGRIDAIEALRSHFSLPQEVVTAIIALFKHEDKNIRSSVIDLFNNWLPSLPQNVTDALVVILEDEDMDIRCSALGVLGKQSVSLPQEAITALVTLLKDEKSFVRDSAIKAIRLRRYRSLPLDITIALVAMLKEENRHTQHSAVRSLREQPSLPPEVFAHLIAMFKDERSSVRVSAVKVLERQRSLPPEVVTALVAMLKDQDKDVLSSAISAASSLSSPPQEITTALIALLKDDLSISLNAAEALGKQSSLPREALSSLIMLLMSPNSTYTSLTTQTPMYRSLYNPKIFGNSTDASRIYRTLHNSNIYSSIVYLNDEAWQQLWRYWRTRHPSFEICCYELEGVLYVWSGGTLHQICTDPKRTEKLLQLVQI